MNDDDDDDDDGSGIPPVQIPLARPGKERPKESVSPFVARDERTQKRQNQASRAKGVRERGTFSTSRKRRMCFGENSTFFVFLNGFVKQQL